MPPEFFDPTCTHYIDDGGWWAYRRSDETAYRVHVKQVAPRAPLDITYHAIERRDLPEPLRFKLTREKWSADAAAAHVEMQGDAS